MRLLTESFDSIFPVCMLLVACLFHTGCVGSNAYNQGQGGYGGGFGCRSQGAPMMYQPPFGSTCPQTIPPPVTGAVGYGNGYAPNPYGQPMGSPGLPPSVSAPVSPSTGNWQSVSPAPNTGAAVRSPAPASAPIPQDVRLSEGLPWQRPGGADGSIAPVGYQAPINSGPMPSSQPYYQPPVYAYSPVKPVWMADAFDSRQPIQPVGFPSSHHLATDDCGSEASSSLATSPSASSILVPIPQSRLYQPTRRGPSHLGVRGEVLSSD